PGATPTAGALGLRAPAVACLRHLRETKARRERRRYAQRSDAHLGRHVTNTLYPLPEHLGIEILRSEVGSTLHGTGLAGAEDHDEMGVFIEYPQATSGLGSVEHYIWRAAGEGERSTPAATDLFGDSLRTS